MNSNIIYELELEKIKTRKPGISQRTEYEYEYEYEYE